ETPRCCEGRLKLPGAEHSTQNFRLIQLAYSGSENRDLIFGTILKTEEIPAEAIQKDRESAALFQTLLDHLSLGVFVMDEAKNFTRWNAAFTKMTSGMVSMKDFFAGNAERISTDERGAMILEQSVSKEEGEKHFEIMRIALDGVVEHGGVLGVVRDVSKRDMHRRQLEDMMDRLNVEEDNGRMFQNCLGEIISGGGFLKNLEEVFDAVRSRLGCSRISFWRRNAQAATTLERFHCDLQWHAQNISGLEGLAPEVLSECLGFWDEEFLNGRIVRIADVSLAGCAKTLEPLKTRSLIFMPVTSGRAFVGVIAAAFTEHLHAFTEADEDIMRAAANLTAAALRSDRETEVVNAARGKQDDRSGFFERIERAMHLPLAEIVRESEKLETSKPGSADFVARAAAIGREGGALMRFVAQLSDFAAIESGKLQLNKEMSDFRRICRELEAVFCRRAAEKGLDFVCDCPDLPLLEMDRFRIRQALISLISCAIGRTEMGELKLSVSFTREKEGEMSGYGSLLLIFSDSGWEIDAKNHANWFDVFAGSGSFGDGHASSGLDLTLAHRLIELMGGALTVSESEEGCVFHILLEQLRYSSVK
ncbi:MAG: GAF domain-containing protein, partial [Victivallaceae bacterium]|nr:GAF domain-containing protein [Victivallaceae bacterium]